MVTTNAVRFPLANVLALVLMGFLFMALFSVTSHHAPVPVVKPVPRIIFTPPLRDPPSPIRDQTKLPPPVIIEPPDIPGIDVPRDEFNFVTIEPPTVTTEVTPTNTRIDTAEAPLVRINPDYPRRAVAAHLEGWVQLQFTISPAGSVHDVAVVDADPKGIFDDAATKAVLRWKYAPKVQDGQPVERRGVQVVLRFNLE